MGHAERLPDVTFLDFRVTIFGGREVYTTRLTVTDPLDFPAEMLTVLDGWLRDNPRNTFADCQSILVDRLHEGAI